MFQSSGKATALLRIGAQPVQQFCETPFGGIDAAAPVDCIQLPVARERGDLGGFFPGTMVAPKVIVVQRFEILIHWDDAGTGGIERDGFDRVALDARVHEGAVHGLGQRTHVVRVTLGGMVWIFFLADQRIFRCSGAQPAASAVENRHTNAERSEIDSRDNAHIRIRPWQSPAAGWQSV